MQTEDYEPLQPLPDDIRQMIANNVPLDDIIRENSYEFALAVTDALQKEGVETLLSTELYELLCHGANLQVALVREYDADARTLIFDKQNKSLVL